ncbi:MAG: hypothetical protein KDA87_26875 [Planctomycetales bacterium]|nr:hypothetical protein [Planctomycetales bacterium]
MSGYSDLFPIGGNVLGNCFVDDAFGVVDWFAGDDYEVDGSTCVDGSVGLIPLVNQLDVLGRARSDGNPDVGAFEWQGQ